jgi:hypothetical protein
MKKETKIYKGWLISDSFLKRSLAVYGHVAFASIVVGVCMMGVAMIIG